jgi:polyhydroxybutyrate depolymerase
MRSLSVGVLLGLVAVSACAGGSGGDDDDAAGGGPTTTAEPDIVPSAGCGQSTVAPGEEQVNITSSGTERWYIRHVPAAHDGETPLPLVFDLPGYKEGASVHVQITELGAFGDQNGFVTVTPHPIGEPSQWELSGDSPDATFIADILDEVEANLCIDTARVYLNGLSNGGMMASILECTMADRFAAMSIGSGVVGVPNCKPSRPVPLVTFHGTADQHLKYDGGFGPGLDPFAPPPPSIDASRPIEDVLADWAERNGCHNGPPAEIEYAADVNEVAYDCSADIEVVLYRVEGGGHTWPGSETMTRLAGTLGPTTMSISANEIMWEFFLRHPLRS